MKITRKHLRSLINKEFRRLNEGDDEENDESLDQESLSMLKKFFADGNNFDFKSRNQALEMMDSLSAGGVSPFSDKDWTITKFDGYKSFPQKITGLTFSQCLDPDIYAIVLSGRNNLHSDTHFNWSTRSGYEDADQNVQTNPISKKYSDIGKKQVERRYHTPVGSRLGNPLFWVDIDNKHVDVYADAGKPA